MTKESKILNLKIPEDQSSKVENLNIEQKSDKEQGSLERKEQYDRLINLIIKNYIDEGGNLRYYRHLTSSSTVEEEKRSIINSEVIKIWEQIHGKTNKELGQDSELYEVFDLRHSEELMDEIRERIVDE